MNSLQGFTRD